MNDTWQDKYFAESPYYLICFSSSGGSFCLGPIVIFSYSIILKSINNVGLVWKNKYIIKKKHVWKIQEVLLLFRLWY